jgi:hypothetical protein
LDLPQQPLSNVVIAGTTIRHMEHKGENKFNNIMACRDGALKHVEPRCEFAMVFHKDSVHPSVEAGLYIANASKPRDELGTVLVVIEPILGPTLHPKQ